MKKLLYGTPIFWFLLSGFFLFIIDKYLSDQIIENIEHSTIEITDGDIQRIKDQWAARSAVVLSDHLLLELLKEDIQETRMYKEALSLGLDQDDVIIKRRLIQKLRFISEDLATFEKPDKIVLQNFFNKNKENYIHAMRVSFKHIYFSFETRGKEAKIEASKLYSDFTKNIYSSDNWQTFGDPFMFGRSFNQTSSEQLSAKFGSDFSNKLVHLKKQYWSKPILSNYGYHLVWLKQLPTSSELTFAQVEHQLIEDYQAKQKQQAFQEYMQYLEKKYPFTFIGENQNISSAIKSLATEKNIQ